MDAHAGGEPSEGVTASAQERQKAIRDMLFDTVAELAGITDPEVLLTRICAQVRRSLGCEISYISTFDRDENISYTRTSLGDPAISFTAVPFATGIGVGGRVTANGHPYATSNYWTDQSIEHDSDLDALLHKESLVALAAAPMVVDGTVFGAVYAVERQPREFSRYDLDILSELAAHAGPAYSRALEYEAARQDSRTLALLTDETGRFQRAALETANLALEDDSIGSSVEDILASFLRQFGLENAEVLPKSQGENEPGLLRVEIPRQGRTTLELVVRPAEEPSEWLWAGIRHTALTIGWVLQRSDLQAASDERGRGELLDDLVAGRTPHLIRDRAQRLKVDALMEGGVALVLLPADQNRRGLHSLQVMSLIREHHLLVEDQGARVVFLLPRDCAEEISAQVAAQFFRETGNGFAGRSAPSTPACYSEIIDHATGLAAAARSLGIDRVVADQSSLGFVGAVLSGSAFDAGQIITRELQPVLDYDQCHGTELLETLRKYLENNQNARSTAEQLHVHPKTVTQRLARLTNLLGARWDAHPRILSVASAVQLHIARAELSLLREQK